MAPRNRRAAPPATLDELIAELTRLRDCDPIEQIRAIRVLLRDHLPTTLLSRTADEAALRAFSEIDQDGRRVHSGPGIAQAVGDGLRDSTVRNMVLRARQRREQAA